MDKYFESVCELDVITSNVLLNAKHLWLCYEVVRNVLLFKRNFTLYTELNYFNSIFYHYLDATQFSTDYVSHRKSSLHCWRNGGEWSDCGEQQMQHSATSSSHGYHHRQIVDLQTQCKLKSILWLRMTLKYKYMLSKLSRKVVLGLFLPRPIFRNNLYHTVLTPLIKFKHYVLSILSCGMYTSLQ